MRYQIKIVPDAEPNDSGEWIDVPMPPPATFREAETVYAEFIPAEYHMIAMQTIT